MAPRLDSLEEKVVFLVETGFHGAKDFMDQAAGWFARNLPAVKIESRSTQGSIFTDDPATPDSTLVKGVHMTQLRTAVNATRVLAQLGAATFTDTISPILQIKKIHIDELRTNLDASRAALGLIPLGYTDSSITASSTTIKAAHVNELRNGVK